MSLHFKSIPVISYENCSENDFIIEFPSDGDLTTKVDIDEIPQFYAFIYPKCIDGSWFEIHEHHTEAGPNDYSYDSLDDGPIIYNIIPSAFDDDYVEDDEYWPHERYKING